jgi:hypothetical protein
MKKLSKSAFEMVANTLLESARPLEKTIFMHEFYNSAKEDILKELLYYQNEDGGFGNGLEPDIRMPYSSPKATSIGLRHLARVDELKEAQEAIERAIHYLEHSFNHSHNRWYIGTRKINDYPHGPWWHFNEIEGITQLDLDWGNPNAEIITYLQKYKKYVVRLNVEKLIEDAILQFENKKVFRNEYKGFIDSMRKCNPPEYVLKYFNTTKFFDPKGEVLCYIRLYSLLEGRQRKRLEERIRAAISEIIVYDEKVWEEEYVAMPLDFAVKHDMNHFGIDEEKIQRNLDLLVKLLETEGKIDLKWAEGRDYYTEERKKARNEWEWVFTLGALSTLRNYSRIED